MLAINEEIVVPGTRLGNTEEIFPGNGTYTRNLHVYASILGVKIERNDAKTSKLPIISVEAISGTKADVVPKVGDRVTVQVTMIDMRQARVKIVAVNSITVRTEFTGVIRKEDVRLSEIDKVEMFNAFRPGDIVEAQVISLGDSRSYFLSTAKVELGVTIARNDQSGVNMIPLSWEEMQCPVTHHKEYRKVAQIK